jgi:hypothetical protein
MDKYKGLRNAAYICQRMGLLGGVLWLLNAVFFFVQYFSEGMKIPDIRVMVQGYGGALIAAIVPVLMLYSVGGVIGLLLDIEANTKKSS